MLLEPIQDFFHTLSASKGNLWTCCLYSRNRILPARQVTNEGRKNKIETDVEKVSMDVDH